MRANGEAVPEPLASKTYSGKFIVRVPPELHRRLVIEAAEAQVSLNLLVSHRLSITAADFGLAGAAPKPQPATKPKRNKATDLETADDAAPTGGFAGEASRKRAQAKRGRKKPPAKRPKQAA